MALKPRQAAAPSRQAESTRPEVMELALNRLIGRVEQLEEEVNSLYQQLDEMENRVNLANRSFTVDIMSKPFLTISECSAYVGMARSTIYKLTSLQQIPFFKKGKFVFFDRVEIDKWLKNGHLMKPQQNLEEEADKLFQAQKPTSTRRKKTPRRR